MNTAEQVVQARQIITAQQESGFLSDEQAEILYSVVNRVEAQLVVNEQKIERKLETEGR